MSKHRSRISKPTGAMVYLPPINGSVLSTLQFTSREKMGACYDDIDYLNEIIDQNEALLRLAIN